MVRLPPPTPPRKPNISGTSGNSNGINENIGKFFFKLYADFQMFVRFLENN